MNSDPAIPETLPLTTEPAVSIFSRDISTD